jgi:hypothetical protein
LYAKEVVLFDDKGVQVSDYVEKLKAILPGDEVIFEGGRYRFKVIEELGEGGVTKILKVKVLQGLKNSAPEIALRIPLENGNTSYNKFRHETPFVNFIDYFVDGMKQLQAAGVRVPKIYGRKKKQFVAVEVVDKDFGLKDFLSEDSKIDSATRIEAEEALIKFSKSIAPFERISDFGEHQVVYSKKSKEWILLDTSHSHSLYKSWDPYTYENSLYQRLRALIYKKDLGDEHRNWLIDLSKKIGLTINTEREKRGSSLKQCALFLRFIAISRIGI